ncbi:MAG TPA: peptidoglycan DD-metalloendopeptidase family protein [Actinomycetota bacterium]|nr:peptidoglycan DD-metalloendopeptidase family protein [Actinomycetota bacterium]
MSSPRSIEVGVPRARTVVAVIAAALLLASLIAGPVRADDPEERPPVPEELKEAKKELRATKEKIRAGNHRLRTLQEQMNRLATSIARTEHRLIRARERLRELQRETRQLELDAVRIEEELDQRNREAYMLGSAPVLYVLTASSAAEAAARLGFLNEMSRRDEELAFEVVITTDLIAGARVEIARKWQVIEIGRLRLVADRKALWKKMARFRQLVAELNVRAEQIQLEISMMRPFGVCPLDGPHAISDSFGIMHHHSKKEGGTHVHQGVDIAAATGTPIIATFDGEAVESSNSIGGMSVKVMGEYGYTYNAHLREFGQLGPVEQGDVIGYVGTTGNASGPHLHFEWHPDDGEAVDPYDFLLLVC